MHSAFHRRQQAGCVADRPVDRTASQSTARLSGQMAGRQAGRRASPFDGRADDMPASRTECWPAGRLAVMSSSQQANILVSHLADRTVAFPCERSDVSRTSAPLREDACHSFSLRASHRDLSTNRSARSRQSGASRENVPAQNAKPRHYCRGWERSRPAGPVEFIDVAATLPALARESG